MSNTLKPNNSLSSISTVSPTPKGGRLVWQAVLLTMPCLSWADGKEQNDTEELPTIEVFGQTYSADTPHNVSGLGLIEKSNYLLQEEQVENIRDITRYDPGISANEAGGRGTSRGFSMRGVEKERVAVNVDGFSSAPMLRRNDRNSLHRPSVSSASINEIEYENLKKVNIRTGAASSDAGSGALGGAVNMATKDTEDFFLDKPKDNIAGRVKTGYTSKDRRGMLSAAIAARHDGWSGFAQYTGRRGHEIRAHQDAYRRGAFIQNYSDNALFGKSGRYFSADEVSGPQRAVPNPLDYHSDSILAKGGRTFADAHYLGMVLEQTQQSYDVRDMNAPNYHTARLDSDKGERIFDISPTNNTIKYTPTRFYHDKHYNLRLGAQYRYQPIGEQNVIDNASVRLDWRKLRLQSQYADLNCAPWPSADAHCWPSEGKLGQLGRRATATLREQDIRLDTKVAKTLPWGSTAHNLALHTGVTHSNYRVDDTSALLSVLYGETKQDNTADTTGNILSNRFFVGLSDRLTFNDALESGIGIRYDHTAFRAKPNAHQRSRGMNFTVSTYNNFSWDANIAYRPFDGLKLGYRISSGFRVPSVVEQIGLSFNLENQIKGWEQPPLKAETSLNQEIGLSFTSAPLNASAGYFISQYNNIIDTAALLPKDGSVGYRDYAYHNVHHFSTHGFDAKFSLYPHALWQKVPAGLTLFAHAGMTKIRKQDRPDKQFGIVSSYAFDAIQPFKLVYGANYHAPSEKWGMALVNTYSKAKDPRELQSTSKQGGLITKGSRFANVRSKDWWVTDLTGYYHINDKLTLRGGIYNLLNYRYITWESARQSSFSQEARISSNNYSALVAPGRNYLLMLEAEF